MAQRISDNLVKTLPAPPSGNKIFYDDDVRGFGVRITAAGAKSFIFNYRAAGRERRHTIGTYPTWSVEKARKKAKELKRDVQGGGDPLGAKRAARERETPPDTFQSVCDTFIARHVDKQALRTADETKRIFRVYVSPKWGKRPFREIRRGDVAKLLDEIEDNNGPVMADRVLAALSKLFNWVASREDDYSSPIVRGMGRSNGRERARKRILSDDEIRLIWKVAGELGAFGAFAQTSLLTGQRRAKVAEMKRNDIAADGTWTIPAEAREKSNAKELRLPKLALDIINAQEAVKKNPYVFAGRGGKAIAGFSKLKAELDAKVAEVNGGKPIEPWVIHDLRRTAKSLMVRAGVRPDVSERVLGHVIAGVEGVYDRHSYADEKAEALRKLAGLVELIAKPPAGNVVSLRKGAA